MLLFSKFAASSFTSLSVFDFFRSAHETRDFRSGLTGVAFSEMFVSVLTFSLRDLVQQTLYFVMRSTAISASVILPFASSHLGDSGIILKAISIIVSQKMYFNTKILFFVLLKTIIIYQM